MLLLLAYPGSLCCSLAQGAIAPCHCCPLAPSETLLPASPGSHSWLLTQVCIAARSHRHSLLPSLAQIVIAARWPRKLTNPERQRFSLKNLGLLVTAAFAAGSYPSKSLLLASPWSHLLLLLASDRPESPCCFLTQGVTATR